MGFSQPGADGLVFSSPEGEHLRHEDFRKRVWTPATEVAGCERSRLSLEGLLWAWSGSPEGWELGRASPDGLTPWVDGGTAARGTCRGG
jgi:hypothetical protein